MKKLTGILCLMFVLATFAFAAAPAVIAAEGSGVALRLIEQESSPQPGTKNLQIQNVGFKLIFDGNVTAESVQDINAKCFTLRDSKDKKIETQVYYGSKRDDYILVIAVPKDNDGNSKMLDSKKSYTLTISGKLQSIDGRTLGEDVKMEYTTVDTDGNTKTYMLLMLVVVAVMIAGTVISTKRKAKAEAEAALVQKSANPYKLAKEKGITVEQAMARIEKEKQKKAKLIGTSTGTSATGASAQGANAGSAKNTKRVKAPRPISAAGGLYKSGRKAVADQKAKEEAALRAKGTTNPKNKGGKGKPRKK
jgi:hypothetical protein